MRGRGNVSINGYTIEVNTDPLGLTQLFKKAYGDKRAYGIFADVPYTSGDSISVGACVFTALYYPASGCQINSAAIVSSTGAVALDPALQPDGSMALGVQLNKQTFTEGTAKTVTGSATFNIGGKNANNQDVADQMTIYVSLRYNPTSGKYIVAEIDAYNGAFFSLNDESAMIGAGYIDSTASSVGEDLYIDCELGEAYVGDQNYNGSVSFPDDLPVLGPGENEISSDNTITSLEIIPRWWRI